MLTTDFTDGTDGGGRGNMEERDYVTTGRRDYRTTRPRDYQTTTDFKDGDGRKRGEGSEERKDGRGACRGCFHRAEATVLRKGRSACEMSVFGCGQSLRAPLSRRAFHRAATRSAGWAARQLSNHRVPCRLRLRQRAAEVIGCPARSTGVFNAPKRCL